MIGLFSLTQPMVSAVAIFVLIPRSEGDEEGTGFHQDVQRKVLEELDAVFGDDVERSVTIEDLNNLKYIEQVIKESLRLYPVVPFVPRTSTKDIEINGYTIPKGCDVFFNIYSLHRNPKIYPNPDEFDPENFSPERSKGRHPYSFLPFSGGMRKCVGYKYAMLQMKVVLATVLRHFTVHPGCDRKEIERWDFNIVLKLVDILGDSDDDSDKDPTWKPEKDEQRGWKIRLVKIYKADFGTSLVNGGGEGAEGRWAGEGEGAGNPPVCDITVNRADNRGRFHAQDAKVKDLSPRDAFGSILDPVWPTDLYPPRWRSWLTR
uniref:Cytochrome P450 n=1 Tax=Timema tahoe TaxID=61484 RepID=A0A7R9IED2_9NEOP|nr:unnamed protein product [Timema tahoe]